MSRTYYPNADRFDAAIRGSGLKSAAGIPLEGWWGDGASQHLWQASYAAPLHDTICVAKRVLANHNTRTSDRAHPEVICGYVLGENHSGSAIHKVGEPFAFIAFSHAMPLILLATFSRMLSHPECIPECGDPSLESATDPVDFPNWQELRPDSLDATFSRLVRTPRCPVRQLAASLLYDLSIQWLAAHEIAHIRFGHLALRELHRKTFDRPEVRRSLEMDADTYSAVQVVKRVCEVTTLPAWTLSPGLTPLGATRLALLWSCAFVASCFHWLDSNCSTALGSSATGNYPHPFVRQIFGLATIRDAAARDMPDDPDLPSRYVEATQGVSLTARNCLSKVWRDHPRDLPKGEPEDVDRQYQECLDTWSSIYDTVAQIAYVHELTP